MIVTDLFSHKIHSSSEDWPQKLIDIATIFSEFEGQLYNRAVIEDRFKQISPRVSNVYKNVRDISKFRDEISAYNAYLGIYRLELYEGEWILRMSETAKRFLIVEEPNVPAYMMLQLIMFQYPNGNGASFSSGRIRLQQNAGNRTLAFIKEKIHLSPFRLICKALLADSLINGIDSLHPRISFEEISILCNDSRINKFASPKIEEVITVLLEARNGNILPVQNFERRFHILNHTDLIQATNGWLHLRETYSPVDEHKLAKLLQIISEIEIQYEEFDSLSSIEDLTLLIQKGGWSNYFDGVAQLSSEIVQDITGENTTNTFQKLNQPLEIDDLVPDNKAIIFKYPLKERGAENISTSTYKALVFSDPEVTRIKRQRSNLQHKILMSHLDEYLRLKGAVPMENEHIDLYAQIPNNGSYLFEIKSVSSENLLSQTRKGLSQLYEYRYRYSSEISQKVTLCLVYSKEPKEIDWLQDYLCNDREIAVAWFEDEKLCFPSYCSEKMEHLI